MTDKELEVFKLACHKRNGAIWGMSLAPWRKWVSDQDEPRERYSNRLWNRNDYKPIGEGQ